MMLPYQADELRRRLMQQAQKKTPFTNTGQKVQQQTFTNQIAQQNYLDNNHLNSTDSVGSSGGASSSPVASSSTVYDPTYQKPDFMTKAQSDDQKAANANKPYSDSYAKTLKQNIAYKLQYTPEQVSKEEMDFYNGVTDTIKPAVYDKKSSSEYMTEATKQDIANNADVMSRANAEGTIQTTGKQPKYIDLPKSLSPQMIYENAQKNPNSEFAGTMVVTNDIAKKWGDNWLPQLTQLQKQGFSKVIVPEGNKQVLMDINDARTLHGATDTGENLLQRAADRVYYNLNEHGLGQTFFHDVLGNAAKEGLQAIDTVRSANENAVNTYQQKGGSLLDTIKPYLGAASQLVPSTKPNPQLTGQDYLDIGKSWLNGASDSLNGNYAQGIKQNVYGTDLLANEGMTKDPSKPWYSPQNLGNTVEGLGLDMAFGLTPSPVSEANVVKRGVVSATATTKDLEHAKAVLNTFKPLAQNPEQEAILKEVENKINNLKAGDKLDFNTQQIIKDLSENRKNAILQMNPTPKQVTNPLDPALQGVNQASGSIDPNAINSSFNNVNDAFNQFAPDLSQAKLNYQNTVGKQLADQSVKNITKRNQDLIDEINNLVNMPVNRMKTVIPDSVSSKLVDLADKTGLTKLDSAMRNSKVGQAFDNGLNNTAKAFNKLWNVDPRIIQKSRELLGQKDLNQANVINDATELFKNTNDEQGKQLLYALSGLHNNPDLAGQFGADISKVDPQMVSQMQNDLKGMSEAEGIPFRENYAPQYSSISKNDLKELWTKRMSDLEKIHGQQYVNDILGAKEKVNIHGLEKTFQHPIEFAQYYADMKGIPLDQAVKKLGLVTDGRVAYARRMLDHQDIMANKQLNDYLNQIGQTNVSPETRDFVNNFLKNQAPSNNPFVKGYDAFNTNFKRAVMNMPILGGAATARNLYGGLVSNVLDRGLADTVQGLGKYGEYRLKNAAQNGALAKLPDSVKNALGLNKGISFNDGSVLTPQQITEGLSKNLVNNAGTAKDLESAKDFRNLRFGKQNPVKNLVSNPQKKFYGIGAAGNQGVENALRGSNVLQGLQDYGTSSHGFAQAAKDAERTHYNYNDAFQTNVEKGLKKVIPFYTFMRQNLPGQLRHMLMNTNRFNQIQYLKHNFQQGNDPSQNDPNFPDYLKNGGIFMGNDASGKPQYFNTSFLPTQDIQDWQNIPNKLMSSITPAVKTIYDMGLANSHLLPQELRDRQFATGYDMNGGRSPITGQKLGQFLVSKFPNFSDKRLGIYKSGSDSGNVLQRAQAKSIQSDISPLISRLGQMANAYDKGQANGDSTSVPKQLLRAMTGLGYSTVDNNMAQNIELSRTLKDQEEQIRELQQEGNIKAPVKSVQDKTSMAGNYNKNYSQLAVDYSKKADAYNKIKKLVDSNKTDLERTKTGSNAGMLKNIFGDYVDYAPTTKTQKDAKHVAAAQALIEKDKEKVKQHWDEFNKYYNQGDGSYPTFNDYLASQGIAVPQK